MTRRECLQMLAASPLLSLRESYEQLEAHKKKFERQIGQVHVKAEWNYTAQDFYITFTRPVFHSNLSQWPNEPCERSTMAFSLTEAKQLAEWIQAL